MLIRALAKQLRFLLDDDKSEKRLLRERLVQGAVPLLCQLGQRRVLGWVPGNPAKLVVLLLVWLVGFGRVAAAELAVMGAVNLLFVAMNLAALRRGIFAFEHPDLFGMPVYDT